MRSCFSAFPEVLFLDATYKLNNRRMPVYLFLSIDGDWQSEVVSVWITEDETKAALEAMVNCFKKANPRWEATAVIMTDKDMTSRDVLRR